MNLSFNFVVHETSLLASLIYRCAHEHTDGLLGRFFSRPSAGRGAG